MRKYTPPVEEDEDTMKKPKQIQYLFFNRTGTIGVERVAKIGETLRICTGKGKGTAITATRESYRGRTSAESWIMINLGKLY